MGSHPYHYFTPYQDDLEAALQGLREREFRAGRYDPALRKANPPRYSFQLKFPPDASWPSPGAQHASIEEAFEASAEDGTGSILDLFHIGDHPDYCIACPVPPDDLVAIFGTTQPTRGQLETIFHTPRQRPDDDPATALFERIERGQGRYIVVYANEEPSEIYFIGYSFD